MAVRSCRVTIRGANATEHTVQVTAATLYEAVALGLAALRGEDWVEEIPEGMGEVKVSVVNIPAEHSVRIKDFNGSVRREGGSPRDRIQRLRVKEILGMGAGRD